MGWKEPTQTGLPSESLMFIEPRFVSSGFTGYDTPPNLNVTLSSTSQGSVQTMPDAAGTLTKLALGTRE